MELIDVECKRMQEKLCFGFCFSSGKETSEISVLLDDSKCSLYLYGAILTKDVSFIGGNTFGSFGFLSRHCFGEGYLSVFVFAFVALLSVRTALAAFTDVIALYNLIAVLCFAFTVIGVKQPFAVWAGEVISYLVITEIFNAV